jgi:hypothetical protein
MILGVDLSLIAQLFIDHYYHRRLGASMLPVNSYN